MVKMSVLGLIFDHNLNSAMVVLLDHKLERALSIWIGSMERNAIVRGMQRASIPRPMTHDLMKKILDEFQVEVVKVVITGVREDTFFAAIHLTVEGKEIAIDSRPSDAIALAVRGKAPIYCAEKVLEAAADLEFDDMDESTDLNGWLKNLKPHNFGEYKM
jgi:bifunctional DNase/RNase